MVSKGIGIKGHWRVVEMQSEGLKKEKELNNFIISVPTTGRDNETLDLKNWMKECNG